MTRDTQPHSFLSRWHALLPTNLHWWHVRQVLLDKGLIKHWGLSNENGYGITMYAREHSNPARHA